MRLSTVVLGGFLTLASEFLVVEAADCLGVALKEIPSCAQSCFINGAPTIGCGGLDFACQCQQQPALMAAIEGCVASKCPSSSYQAVIDGGEAVCACANGFGGGVVTVGSMVSSISGISSIPSASVIGSYPASSFPSYPVTSTVSASPSYIPSTVVPTTYPTTTPAPIASASTVPTAGSLHSSVADIRLIGSIVAVLAFGFVAL